MVESRQSYAANPRCSPTGRSATKRDRNGRFRKTPYQNAIFRLPEDDTAFRAQANGFLGQLKAYDQTPVEALERRFVVTDLVTTMSVMAVGRRMVTETFRQEEDDDASRIIQLT
ncbi:unnamed protein product [Bursaphelenchus okinawaensis]|uniref:Uncharacterized protein n=1 Tax=Bursaphelenchus okinawaensis TaxID=465554 RepID=A0A811JQX6_9BILA|nr:unnamed protein product [Bursaphelenchus okinawaensis]CAG9078893.1 unnamed protein product [Bursaphelenchus okinawaensis]